MLAIIYIERIILLLFGFSIKKNFKPFIIINLSTQLLLTLIVIRGMISQGTLAALFYYIPFEIIILVIEASLFNKFLLEYKTKRRISYAVVTNIVSFIWGIFIMLNFKNERVYLL
jgi:hypothetical protein